ncbi:UNVERIFIED_CONTAM: hypothetical protein GTU68_022382 [Idotea baltica]|nr:hypothetical protein [Idotea baltica]
MSGVSASLHPAVDEPELQQECDFSEALLECQCAENKVTVKLKENISHNHLCGCSECWKPKGALFAQIAVVPSGTTEVTANNDKLEVVEFNDNIQRYECTGCNVHMLGRVNNKDHHFYGLTFVHPELVTKGSLAPPEFAAFVSSLIESGTSASHMQSIRGRLNELELDAYDMFSPEIMDIIAWHQVKLASAKSLEA